MNHWVLAGLILAFTNGSTPIAQTDRGQPVPRLSRTSTTTSGSAGADGCASLPAPWASQDIGTVGLAGSSCQANGVFTVSGAGANIFDVADSFHFAYQPLRGDGRIVARVTGEQNTNIYARAGVMIRQTLTPGSPHVMLNILPSGGVELMTREVNDKLTRYVTATSGQFPIWLQLARRGTTVLASLSNDGARWTPLATINISMTSDTFAGLVANSRDRKALNAATFDHVAVP